MKRCQKTGKVSHASKHAACVAVRRQKKNPIMNVFPCNHCKGWHLGRTNDPARWSDRTGVLLSQHERKMMEKESG